MGARGRGCGWSGGWWGSGVVEVRGWGRASAHYVKNVTHYIKNGALHRTCEALETMLQKIKRTLKKIGETWNQNLLNFHS